VTADDTPVNETASRFTQLDDANASCERTSAELVIYSGDLHPSRVTELLGLSPTRTVATGEKSPSNSRGLVRVGTLNGWFLSSEEHVSSKDLRRHIDWLIAQLRPHASSLGALQQASEVRMYVQCPWWSRTGGGGPSLWPQQMRGLADLNLECTIDFADYSDEALRSG
jgi:Domain of unknown function (DUF4279)